VHFGASKRSLNPNPGFAPSKLSTKLFEENLMGNRPPVSDRLRAVARGGLVVVAIVAVAGWLAGASAGAADKSAPSASPAPNATAPAAAPEPDTPAAASTDDTTTSPVTSDSKRRRARSHYQIESDPDFQSFTNAVETAPWIVGLVFLVVGSIFLTPVVLLVGIIWYKLRRTRLQNEALLKLAERGVMPPAQAVDAVVAGMSPRDTPAAQALDASQTRPIGGMVAAARKTAAWSDLRKGVLMATFGLAFIFYSMIDDGSANWLGLALLFVGAGYVALWYMEDRQMRRPGAGGDAGGGSS
jgi:hypothetical protein